MAGFRDTPGGRTVITFGVVVTGYVPVDTLGAKVTAVPRKMIGDRQDGSSENLVR